MTMNPFEQSTQQLLRFLTSHAEWEVIDYIRQEIQHDAPDSVPTAEELLTFFQSPDAPTELDTYQQMLATDKLLEYAEISLRTLCDLIRYQQLKELGVVHSAKEFIQLFHPDEQEDTPRINFPVKTILHCRTKFFRWGWAQVRSRSTPTSAVLKTPAPTSAGPATPRLEKLLAVQKIRSCSMSMRSRRKDSSPQSQPLS